MNIYRIERRNRLSNPSKHWSDWYPVVASLDHPYQNFDAPELHYDNISEAQSTARQLAEEHPKRQFRVLELLAIPGRVTLTTGPDA